jgi:hypothetical protein
MSTNSVGRKLRQSGILKSIVAVAVASISLHAESKLTASSSNSTTIEIRLENDQLIAGIQFVVRSSPDIILQEIHNSGRTAKGNWTVASNRLNDSTLSVVIMCTALSSFSIGSGVIAEITVSRTETQPATGFVAFTHVVAADPQANLVNVTAIDFAMNSQDGASAVSTSDFSLGQNYPNPFNPSTRINYELTKGAQIRLTIFDITGREISRLVDQYQTTGSYTVIWNSSENRWGQLASGTYFARLQVGDNVVTRKMLLTK